MARAIWVSFNLPASSSFSDLILSERSVKASSSALELSSELFLASSAATSFASRLAAFQESS